MTLFGSGKQRLATETTGTYGGSKQDHDQDEDEGRCKAGHENHSPQWPCENGRNYIPRNQVQGLLAGKRRGTPRRAAARCLFIRSNTSRQRASWRRKTPFNALHPCEESSSSSSSDDHDSVFIINLILLASSPLYSHWQQSHFTSYWRASRARPRRGTCSLPVGTYPRRRLFWIFHLDTWTPYWPDSASRANLESLVGI
jgi:hypothetical protein